MKQNSAIALGVAALALFSVAAGAQHKYKKPKPAPAPAPGKVAYPKEENKFVTVEEFVKAHRGAGSAVSIEGYEVIAFPTSDGGLQLNIVDSVDHVLTAKDAVGFAQGGAVGIIPASALRGHPGWGWSNSGMKKYAMWTGPGTATKELHDIVAKMRFTGFTSGGRTINLTKIEFADDNGDFRAL